MPAIFEICKKLGLEPMIWSDMYITTNTGGGYYDVADDTDCSDWEKPDPELGLVYWDYYNPDQKIYEKMIRVHQQLSNKSSLPEVPGSGTEYHQTIPRPLPAPVRDLPHAKNIICRKSSVPPGWITVQKLL